MHKIPTLFQRNHDTDRLVRDELTPGCEWVVAGEGVATRKFDGSCCLIRDGKLYKRHEVKPGKTPPPNFEPASDVDPETGKQQGWLPVGDGPEDRWFREAFFNATWGTLSPVGGTYEAVGLHFQGNPEGYQADGLIQHGAVLLPDCTRDFDGLRSYLTEHDIEGIVWHHPDGRMVKIKGKDFGIKRGRRGSTT